MTTPEKMSNTSETGEISQPLSLPEKRKSAEFGNGIKKRQQPGAVKRDTVIAPTFGCEIGEGSRSSQPPEKELGKIGEGAPKSRPLTEEQHLAVVAPASGSEIGEGCPQLPPAGTQKLPPVIAPATGSEIGEGCPPPKGTEEVPEKESAEDVAQPPTDGFQRGGKVYVPGKRNKDELREFFYKRGIPKDKFFEAEEIYCIPPPPCPSVCICKRAH